MPNYYLDIETTGLEPVESEILTIQWCELDRNTGKKIGDLHILKSWESSEREILEKFADSAKLSDPYDFAFVPVGFNLSFEHKFLSYRSDHHKTFPVEITARPHIDLHQLAILLNGGEFKGTRLSNMTNKEADGNNIPLWYKQEQYEEIEKYIRNETDEFVKFTEWAFKTIPPLRQSLKDYF